MQEIENEIIKKINATLEIIEYLNKMYVESMNEYYNIIKNLST